MTYIIRGKTKGTILCIHGNSSSAKVYQELLESDEVLNTKISVDLNGHGNNQNSDYNLEDFSVESYKKFLIKEISKIDDDILLIGNSLGGHLAIEIANEINNLKGLVIMGTPPLKKPINFENAFLPVEALSTFLTELPKEKEIKYAFDVVLEDKSKSSSMISDFKIANPLVRKATAIDLMENKLLDQFKIFTELNIPKYIIAGDSDISVNREYLEIVKNNCSESCLIIDIENCGHYPSVDQPTEFIKIIKEISKNVFN